MLADMPDDLERYNRQNPSCLPLNREGLVIAPKYLHNTIAMLHGAYPDGLPLEDYFILLTLFRREGWSHHGVAAAMQACFKKEYIDALHDAYAADDRQASSEKLECLQQKLAPHGFEAWEKEKR